jgi:hypothetical protein
MWHKDASWSKFLHGTKQIILIPEHFKAILYAKCYPTMGGEKRAVHLYYIPLPNYEIAVKEVNTMKH